MKLLVDENLSVRVADLLRGARHDAVHTLLALRGDHRPSVLMLRSSDHLTPQQQAELIAVAVRRVESELEQGAIASVTPERIRLRTLPIAPD